MTATIVPPIPSPECSWCCCSCAIPPQPSEDWSMLSDIRCISFKGAIMRNTSCGSLKHEFCSGISLAIVVMALVALFAAQTTSAQSAPDGTVRVDASHVINSFDPDSALGSSIDVLSRMDINAVFTPHIIQESLSAGWGPITYRNNTELRMAAWHWNENGAWSDAA